MKRKGSPVAATAGVVGPRSIDETTQLATRPRATHLGPRTRNRWPSTSRRTSSRAAERPKRIAFLLAHSHPTPSRHSGWPSLQRDRRNLRSVVLPCQGQLSSHFTAFSPKRLAVRQDLEAII